MSPYTSSSGAVTPEGSVLDAPLNLPVHPTAARRVPDLITVQSPNTEYTEEYITSDFQNRGASVGVEQEGRFVVQPTVEPFQFRTARKVPRTGYARFYIVFLFCIADVIGMTAG